MTTNRSSASSVTPKRPLSQVAGKTRRAQWVCNWRDNPIGNGGLFNVANYDGYDRAAYDREFAAEKAWFDATRAERETSDRSIWVFIFNMDIIMQKNNILELPRGVVPELPLNDLNLIRVPKLVEKRYFEGRVKYLWMLMSLKTGNPLIAETKEYGLMMLAFEFEDDALRFALNLENDDRGRAQPMKVPFEDIEKECHETGKLIGLIAPSFVQPSHFGGDLN